MTQKTIRRWAPWSILGSWLIYVADILIAISDGFGKGFWQHMPDLAAWKVDFAGYALLLFSIKLGQRPHHYCIWIGGQT